MGEITRIIGNVSFPPKLVDKVEENASSYKVRLKDGTRIFFDAQPKEQEAKIVKDGEIIDFKGFDKLIVYGTNDDNSYRFKKCTGVSVDTNWGKDEIRFDECKDIDVSSWGSNSKVGVHRSTKGNVRLYGYNAQIDASLSKELKLKGEGKIGVYRVEESTIWGSEKTRIRGVAGLSRWDNPKTTKEFTPDLKSTEIVNIPEKNVLVDTSDVKYYRQ